MPVTASHLTASWRVVADRFEHPPVVPPVNLDLEILSRRVRIDVGRFFGGVVGAGGDSAWVIPRESDHRELCQTKSAFAAPVARTWERSSSTVNLKVTLDGLRSMTKASSPAGPYASENPARVPS